jgi:L-fucose mutarotase/ribose pyranase (RbsD/FucU family)
MSELTPGEVDWERRLGDTLPLFGHRNWIVVADAAYPAQSNPGIETIIIGADQIHVLRKVVDAIAASKHIRANVYLDHELQFVPELDAPGVANYKQELELLLADSTVNRHPHEQIIDKLDQSALVFRVLILKTPFAIPYSSVFFELDCGYWNRDAEQRLREAMMEADAK